MNILTLEHVYKSYTDRNLLEDVSLGIQEHDKIGVVGINGMGKSTLLKVVAGVEEYDSGKISMGNHVTMRYLPQNPVFPEEMTVLEAALQNNYEEDAYWSRAAEAKALLNQLEIKDFDQKVNELSGGQRKRVALVQAILIPAELLILDEPTNHLDHDMAEWLESFLNNYRGAVLMVTHDRYFLDRVSNQILEVDQGHLYQYTGNFSDYLTGKAERESQELTAEHKRKSLLRTELEWLKRGARARSTKQKAHVDRIHAMQEIKDIQEKRKLELDSITTRMGNKTIELKHISKSYGNRSLIQDFSYHFLRSDRIGIIGKNGCGKTTLIKMLTGVLAPDSGEIEVGQTIQIGYFSQESEYMDHSMKAIDYIKEAGEYVTTTDGKITASQMLERFLFDGAKQWAPIEKLSGGERRRLYLLRILMASPNVLVLDEPTNDLDIETLNVLEDYLDRFEGIVIVVSHDRYFLDRVVSRIFAFEPDGIRQYEGNYTDYYWKHRELYGDTDSGLMTQDSSGEKGRTVGKSDSGNASEDGETGKSWKRPDTRLKFTYKEQKEYETIDEDIAKLENRIAELEQLMPKAATDFVKLTEYTNEKEDLEQQLEEKMERWVYLNDLAEKIKNEHMSNH
ncbi:MAG: ABC-F family ATP-binding cassette domain-containing protein [Clostridium sp.]|nr:ABC-F family ATP-binding cassette domain-containing protein [Clostridium sp.]